MNLIRIYKNIVSTLFILIIVSLTVPGQIRINAVGDVMPGSVTPRKILPPENGNEFIESINNYLACADIVFGNLEGALITNGMKPEKCREESRKAETCFEFGIPEHLAVTLKKLGFNVLSLDNNHSEDYGIEGYEFTKQKLSEFGISFAPKKGFAALTVKDKKIALIAFGYSGNSYNISDLANTTEVISTLNEEFDLVIVSFHGGAESRNAQNVRNETEFFLGENRGNIYAFAHTAIDAGADLVIGHGPHVLRALEIYKEKLIAYSLGNFLTYGNMNISGVTGITAILDIELDEITGDFLKGKIIPVKQVDRGIPVFDETHEAVKLISNLTTEDFTDSKIFFHPEGYFFDLFLKSPPPRPLFRNFPTRERVEKIRIRGRNDLIERDEIKVDSD